MSYIFLFILGSAIGSFLNVLIDRLPFEKSIQGRSYCDHCHHKLSWYDLFPIVSFVLLGGKCRYCKKRLPFQYPLVEILTGLMFVFTWKTVFLEDSLLLRVSLLGIMSCLMVIFFSDLKYHIIPDSIQIALFIFVLILLPFQGPLTSIFVNRVMAALVIAAPIFFIHFFTAGRAMGFGDVKLSFTIGFLLGAKAGFLALYFAFVIGGIVGLFLILLGRKKLKSKIAFGPFLVLGVVMMLFWQREIFEIIKGIYGF